MPIDRERVRWHLKEFDFRKLFVEELGWDNFHGNVNVSADGRDYRFEGVAEKRNVAVLLCRTIPEYAARVKIDRLVARHHYEHLIIFADESAGRQEWQWVRKERGKPTAVRNFHYAAGASNELLLQRLEGLAFSIDEEEDLVLSAVTDRLRREFDSDKVTKKFYDRFQAEHAAFKKFLRGIPDDQMQSWYVSVMLNRLMFLYFIQEKGFLNDDRDYLRNKLAESRARRKDAYYTEFLVPLFFQGFAQKKADRSAAVNTLLGDIPYLNGGLFQRHQIEELHGNKIQIVDAAFEKLFDFFKEYRWHLDERENQDDREINPDVLGYIFEKYINQKQMGAYYTKEDITEYIGQNTIIPFLLDEARRGCSIAFAEDGSVWRLPREDPDRYIHDAMKVGASLALPPDIEAGVSDVSKRTGWNRPAAEGYGLPTEIWRETIDRHQRYRAVKQKLASGEVHEVNDLVTLNLNIRQFAQDAIQFCEGSDLLRAFWEAIANVSVLDPTCGSGAFLFAALNILRPLYEACLNRMRGFIEDMEAAGPHRPEKLSHFTKVLQDAERHPNQDYFILKAIIVNNLFGVDIMEEAVEICKLRLFLKLAAQVESPGRIEPLPDIDFNIRAGNSLIGYMRLAELRNRRDIRTEDENSLVAEIDDEASRLDSAVRVFRAQQTQLNGHVSVQDKTELNRRFVALATKLDEHLSGEYGAKREEVRSWRRSHRPFHWICDFHSLMNAGGFDVIIGNPPYLETSKFTQPVPKQDLRTKPCPDIYAWIFERALALKRADGRLGLIVPVSIASSGAFSPLRVMLFEQRSAVWMSHFANRPGQLFTGGQNRLSIVLLGDPCHSSHIYSTRYHRWDGKNGERDTLLSTLTFANISRFTDFFGQTIPKMADSLALQVVEKVTTNQPLARSATKNSDNEVLWVRVPGYFCQFHLHPPMVRPVNGGPERPRGELLKIRFPRRSLQKIAHAALNSSTFYVYFCITTDGRHINPSDVALFPLTLDSISHDIEQDLLHCSDQIARDFARHTSRVRKSGLLIDSVNVAMTKGSLDKADATGGSLQLHSRGARLHPQLRHQVPVGRRCRRR